MGHRRTVVAVALVLATALAACSSSKSSTKTTTGGGATTSAPGLTASFRGVTATSIKLGVALIDYECIKQFIDFSRPNQQAIEQSFIDYLNKNGGVDGRQIVPVYQTYCPIDPKVALQTCTSFTDDSQVFAVVGVFAPTSPDAQLCVSRDHQTILIDHELEQATIAQAPAGLLISTDITAERRVNVLMNLLKSQNTLTGKKVAILADQDSKASADSVITPGLNGLGVPQGSEGVVTISGTDTSAAQAQLDSFIEKWKSEGVTAVFLAGLNVSSKQFVEKIKSAMPNVVMLADHESGAHDAAQGEVTAHKSPNPYEGMLTAFGASPDDVWNSAPVQKWAKIYEAASGQTVLGPSQVKPGPDGKTAQVYQSVEDFAEEIDMFAQLANKAGPDLTNTTWTNAVENFGSINIVGEFFASLTKGKYDADNGFRLGAFDSTIPPQGDWKPITPLVDASK